MRSFLFYLLYLLLACTTYAQENSIEEKEVNHYVPLYLDIPTELNVRKGYKDVSLAGGFANFRDFRRFRTLVEYGFAPVDKLGVEIEMPFVFIQRKSVDMMAGSPRAAIPEEGGAEESVTALRVGVNYSFLTLPRARTTFSAGYFNEIETSPFARFGKPLLASNLSNPFVVAAKIWGERFHTMIYTGPALKRVFERHETKTQYLFNTIISYRIGRGDAESFIGLESNQVFASQEKGQMILRPQVLLPLNKLWKLGIVTSVPIATSNHLKGHFFFRLIYLPKH